MPPKNSTPKRYRNTPTNSMRKRATLVVIFALLLVAAWLYLINSLV